MKNEITTKSSLVVISVVLLFGMQNCVSLYSQDSYSWYGKRFDWVLDLYSKNPNHTDSVHLFISEIGKGKDTFLVIHGGFGAEHSYLLDAFLPLADDVHFIFYDQRGSLRSSCPDSLITLDAMIYDIERIRKAMKIDKINIVSHSMGTYLTLEYLKKYPDNTGRLILISSLPLKLSLEDTASYYSYQRNHINKMYGLQPELWRTELEKRGLINSFSRDKISLSQFMYMQQFWAAAGTINDYNNWEKDNKGSTFLFKWKVGSVISPSFPEFYDFTNEIKKHNHLVYLIKASGDYLSPELLKKQSIEIGNVEYYLMDNAGHNPWLEEPDKFKEIMKSIIIK